MTDTKKNYTDAQTAEAVERYEAANDEAEREEVIKAIANDFAKTTRSIIAKLSREGVYIKKVRAPAGKATETKEKIVGDIASALGVTAEQVPGLEKATKAALTLIRGTLQRLYAVIGEAS